MRALSLLLLLGFWPGLAGQVAAQEQDKEAKAVLEKAIKAMGGADRLNKHAAILFKGKGTVHVMNMELPFTGEFALQFPDKIRQTIDVEVKGMKFTTVQVFDGKKAWVKVNDKTQKLDDKKLLTEFTEGTHSQRVISLYKIDKTFGLSLVGDAKVKDKAAIGLRVSFKGRRDVNLYFDKDKNFLIKAEHRSLDPTSMKEVTREEYFSDHKEVDGILMPHRVVILHDGEPFLEFDLTEGRYLEKHEDGTFAEP